VGERSRGFVKESHGEGGFHYQSSPETWRNYVLGNCMMLKPPNVVFEDSQSLEDESKDWIVGWAWWLTSRSPATWEEEIGRIIVQDQHISINKLSVVIHRYNPSYCRKHS
jgi:hypothetical protein